MGRLICAAIVLLMVACGGGSGGSNNNEADRIDNNVSSINDIVGLWDATEETEEGVDNVYWGISPSGSLSIYDYLGDTFDDIANCYFIAEDFGLITNLGDSNFIVQIDDGVEVLTANIELSTVGDDLIMVFIDEEEGDDSVRLSPSSLSLATIRSMECVLADTSDQEKMSQAQLDVSKKVLRFFE